MSQKTVRLFLFLLFSGILAGMIAVTVTASLERGIFVAGQELMQDAWFRATLCDAYFGFITFYVWVAYRERRIAGQIGWFVAIMLLGNIAMSIYVLLQLIRMAPDAPLESLLLRRS
jgi:hypothetical protein